MTDNDTKAWAIARRLPHEAPSRQDLAHAPVIDNWRLIAIGEHLVITGNVAGSPKFRDRSSIRTSALKCIERLRPQWTVTQNSIYRLGIPYDEGRSLLLRAALER
ncbi:hypothetical protein MXD81_29535, partial [Microbacteriaceae bacterium K1510]|nr:hypothetical protein [Microbacteriaceae bacterium K1510]